MDFITEMEFITEMDFITDQEYIKWKKATYFLKRRNKFYEKSLLNYKS